MPASRPRRHHQGTPTRKVPLILIAALLLAVLAAAGSRNGKATADTTRTWRWDARRAHVTSSSAAEVSGFLEYALGEGAYFETTVAWEDAPPGTPQYSIPVVGQSIGAIEAPIPLGTRPGNTFDRSLTVRASDGVDYDFGLAEYDPVTQRIAQTDGAAVVPPGAVSERGPGSANAARFPLRAGPITPADIRSGAIDHPLVISMPNVGGARGRFPARTNVGFPMNSGLPLGAWLRLDPTVDVKALRLPPLETKIAVAMQRYGMFVRDIGTTLCIIATDQVNQGGNAHDWSAVGVTLPERTDGVPYARRLSDRFPWNRLQVLRAPTR
jgi:hypothetical protein